MSDEPPLHSRFNSSPLPSLWRSRSRLPEMSVMGEFLRSGAILLMGLIVIGAGIFVVFHHVAFG